MAEAPKTPPSEASRSGEFERLFTIQELAGVWSLSASTIRRMFEHEAGTLVFSLRRPGKRRDRTIRVPRSVAERVYRRLTR